MSAPCCWFVCLLLVKLIWKSLFWGLLLLGSSRHKQHVKSFTGFRGSQRDQIKYLRRHANQRTSDFRALFSCRRLPSVIGNLRGRNSRTHLEDVCACGRYNIIHPLINYEYKNLIKVAKKKCFQGNHFPTTTHKSQSPSKRGSGGRMRVSGCVVHPIYRQQFNTIEQQPQPPPRQEQQQREEKVSTINK